MKTNNDFSAHSPKGLGAVVAHASQRGNQSTVIVGDAIPEQSSPTRSLSQRGNQRNVTLGSVTHYNVTLGDVTHYVRAAMMLLMMLLTATTAWAFKAETTSYSISFDNSSGKFQIKAGSTVTDSWTASVTSGNIYWKEKETHQLANGMNIKPDQRLYYVSNSMRTELNSSTTFTFTAPNSVAITNVVFKNGSNVVSGTNTAYGSSYTVTLASGTAFTGFEVTYGTITGSCGSGVTWTLSQQNGQYTVLAISGNGAMTNEYSHDNANIWHTDAPWGYDLTSVTIGNSITSIGKYAFCGCQQLATATIGTGVTTIGEFAFNHCDALTEVTLPASVSSIGEQCFRNSAGLLRVNIQRTNGDLITLGSKVFNGCDALKYIVAPTPELAVQYKTASNWNASEGKMSAEFGGYLFYATNEGGSPAYAITTAADLSNLAAAVNAGNDGYGKTFCQTVKIDFDNTKENNYTPIGNANRYFKGNYDGRGHTISGIRIKKDGNGDSDKYQGVFGWTDGATIQGITLADADITGNNQTGGIAGYNKGTVSDCHVAANVFIRAVQSNVSHHGGIVGQNEGTVSDCTSAATLTSNGGTSFGGIAGINSGTLSHNFAIGAVVPYNSENSYGAVCGINNGTLRNNYYHACKVASNDVTATGVGCNKADVTSNNGAVPAFLVNLGNRVTIQTEMADNLGFTYGGNDYWRQGAGLTLVNTLGNAPEGYTVRYATTVGTINGSTLTVGSADATVTATFRSDGHSHSVSYMEADGTTGTHDAIALDGSEITLSSGWYFVGTNIHYPQTVTLDGDVTIILTDGCTMSVGMAQSPVSYHGIYGKDHSLSIYAQSTGESKGQLYVSSSTCGIFTKGLTINSGTVTSNSNSGFSVSESNLLIKGGKVTATGTSDYGISASLGNVEISGGIVEATGSAGNGICANSGKVEISGGKVEATGAAGNYGIKANNITLGWTNADDYIYANSYSGTVTFANGKGFADEDGNIYSGTYDTQGGTPFKGKTLTPAVVLADNADNSDAIADAATACVGSKTLPVQLKGRTLYKDGDWNTICLPFNVTLSGSPLAGAEARPLSTASITGTTLNLTFGDAVSTLVAGTPYIIKWGNTEGTEPTEATEHIVNPVFKGVTVRSDKHDYDTQSASPAVTTDGRVRFLGTYDQKTIDTEDKSILFLGAANTLYYPSGQNGGVTIGAFRAYFKIGDGDILARQLTAFNFGFGDGSEETGIVSLSKESGNQGNNPKFLNSLDYYTLDGVRLDRKPTKKGLYIHGGKKVLVRDKR